MCEKSSIPPGTHLHNLNGLNFFPRNPHGLVIRRGIKAGDRSREGWMYQASRARRRSLAAGMTLALACRGAALITNSASAVVRARVANAATPNPAVRLLSRRTALGVARRVGGSSPVHCANGGFHMMRRAVGGRVTMCSAAGASAVEVSAEGLELEASIKTKGDTIRELKAGGASKDDLKPHIEVRVFIALLLVDAEVAHMLTRWAQHRCSSCDTCRQTDPAFTCRLDVAAPCASGVRSGRAARVAGSLGVPPHDWRSLAAAGLLFILKKISRLRMFQRVETFRKEGVEGALTASGTSTWL